jgi:hypothetical protein
VTLCNRSQLQARSCKRFEVERRNRIQRCWIAPVASWQRSEKPPANHNHSRFA